MKIRMPAFLPHLFCTWLLLLSVASLQAEQASLDERLSRVEQELSAVKQEADQLIDKIRQARQRQSMGEVVEALPEHEAQLASLMDRHLALKIQRASLMQQARLSQSMQAPAPASGESPSESTSRASLQGIPGQTLPAITLTRQDFSKSLNTSATPDASTSAIALASNQQKNGIPADSSSTRFKFPSEEDKPALVPLVSNGNQQAAMLVDKSLIALNRRDWQQALDLSSQAIVLDPGQLGAHINRIWARVQLGQLDEASKDCEQAKQLSLHSALVFNNCGLLHERKSMFRQAKLDYEAACLIGFERACQNFQALEGKPVARQLNPGQLLDRSYAAFRQADYPKVIYLASLSYYLNPDNPVALTNRAAAYAKQGDWYLAWRDAHEAVEIAPDYAMAWNNRGFAFAGAGQITEAKADYHKACDMGLKLACDNLSQMD